MMKSSLLHGKKKSQGRRQRTKIGEGMEVVVSRSDEPHEIGHYLARATEDESGGFVRVLQPGLFPRRARLTSSTLETFQTVAPSAEGLPRNKFERWADENVARLSGGLTLGTQYWIPTDLLLGGGTKHVENNVPYWPARALNGAWASTPIACTLFKVARAATSKFAVPFKVYGEDVSFDVIQFDDPSLFLELHERSYAAYSPEVERCPELGRALVLADREPCLLPPPPPNPNVVVDVDTFDDALPKERRRRPNPKKEETLDDDDDLEELGLGGFVERPLPLLVEEKKNNKGHHVVVVTPENATFARTSSAASSLVDDGGTSGEPFLRPAPDLASSSSSSSSEEDVVTEATKAHKKQQEQQTTPAETVLLPPAPRPPPDLAPPAEVARASSSRAELPRDAPAAAAPSTVPPVVAPTSNERRPEASAAVPAPMLVEPASSNEREQSRDERRAEAPTAVVGDKEQPQRKRPQEAIDGPPPPPDESSLSSEVEAMLTELQLQHKKIHFQQLGALTLQDLHYLDEDDCKAIDIAPCKRRRLLATIRKKLTPPDVKPSIVKADTGSPMAMLLLP